MNTFKLITSLLLVSLCRPQAGDIPSPIEIKVSGFYNLERNGDDYYLNLNPGSQTLVRLEGTIDRAEGYHRVTWETEKAYCWSNGMAADVFKVVNPASYSKNGKIYTMFGPLPEMKGRTVVITAHYYGHSDTIRIHLL